MSQAECHELLDLVSTIIRDGGLSCDSLHFADRLLDLSAQHVVFVEEFVETSTVVPSLAMSDLLKLSMSIWRFRSACTMLDTGNSAEVAPTIKLMPR